MSRITYYLYNIFAKPGVQAASVLLPENPKRKTVHPVTKFQVPVQEPGLQRHAVVVLLRAVWDIYLQASGCSFSRGAQRLALLLLEESVDEYQRQYSD